MLDREQILGASDIQREEVAVPEWGGSVFVRGLSGAERERYEESLIVQRGNRRERDLAGAYAKLVILGTVDEKGAAIFTMADVAALSKKSARALYRVFARIRDLSGLNDEAVEELLGNSEGDRRGGSGSS